MNNSQSTLDDPKLPLALHRAWLFIGSLIIFYIVMLAAHEYIDNFTRQFIRLRTEYRVVEQLSKYCLLVIMLTSIITLKFATNTTRLKVASAFFALALSMYFSESNMIHQRHQPVIGIALLLPIFFWMRKLSSYLEALVLMLGFSIITLGVLSDMIQEDQIIAELIPTLIANVSLKFNEETLDVTGIGVICLSALLFCRRDINIAAQAKAPMMALTFIFATFIAVGNGLCHYQYKPTEELRILGFGLAFIGLSGVIAINQFGIKKTCRLTIGSPITYYLIAGYVFLYLPCFVNRFSSKNNSALLAAGCLFLAFLLYYHSKNRLFSRNECRV